MRGAVVGTFGFRGQNLGDKSVDTFLANPGAIGDRGFVLLAAVWSWKPLGQLRASHTGFVPVGPGVWTSHTRRLDIGGRAIGLRTKIVNKRLTEFGVWNPFPRFHRVYVVCG